MQHALVIHKFPACLKPEATFFPPQAALKVSESNLNLNETTEVKDFLGID